MLCHNLSKNTLSLPWRFLPNTQGSGVYANAGLNVFANFKLIMLYKLITDTSLELADSSFTEIELLEMFLCHCDSILCSVIANLGMILR